MKYARKTHSDNKQNQDEEHNWLSYSLCYSLIFHLSYIPQTNRNKTGNGKLSSIGDEMKNLRGIERGRVWRRPVKIKELETKNKVIGTLREIDLVT